jgi:hypothetical protein
MQKLGRPCLKNKNTKQNVWGHGFSDRVLAYHVQSPEFNPQYYKEQTNKQTKNFSGTHS